MQLKGGPQTKTTPSPDEERREVSPDYFRALGTPLIKGRFFTDADKADAPLVIIVNQAFAKKFWPNEDALGKRIVMGGMSDDPKWITIVGIVGDMRHFGLDVDPKPEMYVPFAQSAYFTTIYVVRSNQDPQILIAAIRREIQAIDPAVPLANVRSFENLIGDSVAPRRLSVVLLGVFAGVAVLLAGVGIYGVMSFLVVQRTHELGVRMALGAQRSDVLKLVLIRSLKLISAGTIIGLIVAVNKHAYVASIALQRERIRHRDIRAGDGSTWRDRTGGKLSAGNARNQGRPNGRARPQYMTTYDQTPPSRTQIPVR